MGGFSGPDTESMAAAGNLRGATSRLGLSYERGPPPFRASVFGGATLEASLRELEASLRELEVLARPTLTPK